jgi:hypothetical protein
MDYFEVELCLGVIGISSTKNRAENISARKIALEIDLC